MPYCKVLCGAVFSCSVQCYAGISHAVLWFALQCCAELRSAAVVKHVACATYKDCMHLLLKTEDINETAESGVLRVDVPTIPVYWCRITLCITV